MRIHCLTLSVALLIVLAGRSPATDLPQVTKVELQPLAAQVLRLVEALDYLGVPLPEADKQTLQAAGKDKARGVQAIQTILDKHCLAGVRLQADNRLETLPGPAKPELAEQGWRVFLVKVDNTSGLANTEL